MIKANAHKYSVSATGEYDRDGWAKGGFTGREKCIKIPLRISFLISSRVLFIITMYYSLNGI